MGCGVEWGWAVSLTIRIESVGGETLPSVKITNERGYWAVAFEDEAGCATLDGRMCLAEVIEWVLYQSGKSQASPARMVKRVEVASIMAPEELKD